MSFKHTSPDIKYGTVSNRKIYITTDVFMGVMGVINRKILFSASVLKTQRNEYENSDMHTRHLHWNRWQYEAR